MERRATIRQVLVAMAVMLASAGLYAQRPAGTPSHPAPVVRMAPSYGHPRPQNAPPRAGYPAPQQRPAYGPAQQPAPVERRSPETVTPSPVGPIQRREAGTAANGQHLAEWMQHHSTLTLPEQQRALQSEPGFRDLPPQTQQSLMNRLAQLNAMPPAQRQRMIQRNEAMERLSPTQRGEVRMATQQWASLPPDQKFAVARSFRALRMLPPEQRAAALASGRFTAPFNPQQRAALDGLLRVEPLLPPDQ